MKSILIFVISMLFSVTVIGQWEQSNFIHKGTVYSIAVDENKIVVGGRNLSDSTNGIFYSENYGRAWEYYNSEFEGFTNPILKNGILFAGYGFEGGGVLRSTNYGKSWEKLSGLPIEGVADLEYVDGILFASMMSDYNFVGVWKSIDNGDNWSRSWNGCVESAANLCLTSFDSTIYVGTHRGGIYASRINMDEWIQINSGLPKESIAHSIIGLNGKLYSAIEIYTNSVPEYGIYTSNDFGQNWVVMDENKIKLSAFRTNMVTDGHNVFLQTYNQLWILRENDSIWQEIKYNLPNDGFNSVTILDGKLLVGTSLNGLWQISIVDLLSLTPVNSSNLLKAEFKLLQNYPNPFNPSTTISYSLPRSGFVQLKVYDMLGREVVDLVNKEQKMGNYKAKFNAKNLSSGVYLYKLQAGNFQQIKKLILVK